MKQVWAMAAVVMLGGAAYAADTSSPLDPLYACRAISDPAARLSCFDENTAKIQGAERAGEVVSIDKTKAESIQREAFGFHMPSLPKLGLPGSGADLEAIQASLTQMIPLGEGQYIFQLDNGQVWEQIDDRVDRPRMPATVTVKKGAMGSYLLKVGNQRAVRVKRAQ